MEQRLIDRWRSAANDLDITVEAPVELRDATGVPFLCEVMLTDFGSAGGAIIVSAKTERRIRANLRSLGPNIWVAISERRPASAYDRDHVIAELMDFGWFGEAGKEPDWYVQRNR